MNGRRARGRRLTLVSAGGAVAVIAVDAAASHGMEVAPWSEAWRERLRPMLPNAGSLRNPIDVGSGIRPEHFESALAVAAEHDESDATVVLTGNVPEGSELEAQFVEMLARAYAATDKPFVVCWSGGMSPTVIRTLGELGIPAYADPARAVAALGLLVNWSLRPGIPAPLAAVSPPASGAAARAVIARARADGRAHLDEHESKQVLSAYGVACAREATAGSPQEAVEVAERIGYPVVVKLLAPALAHKTELGVVRLGLADGDSVRAAAAAVLAVARAEDLQGAAILVQEMCASGVELIMGAMQDPVMGPVAMVGIGGILAEVLHDVSLARAPLGAGEAARMLAQLRGARLLDGLRGRPPADRAAATDTLERIAAMAADLADELAELDVNPVIVGQSSAVAVDALIVLRDTAEPAR